jgi:DNA-binding NarL/FixJ family response regulator
MWSNSCFRRGGNRPKKPLSDGDGPRSGSTAHAALPMRQSKLEDTVAAGLESALDNIPVQAVATDNPGFTAMVVDDHPLVRESMVNRLKMMGAREVVEAATIGEARARANLSGPRELCVLDLGLPDGSGLDLLADLRSAGWQRLVVLSAADDPYSVRAAFVAGAQGYLLKSASPVVVADGVRRVLDGGVYADPSVASLLAAGLRGGPVEAGISELSGREVEVLRLVADGQSNKQIGDDLGLSALTVKSHLARIARKLGTGDRAEMVALAMRAGVIR